MLSQDTNNWVERMVAKLRRPKRTKTTEYKLSKRQRIQGMRTNNKM